MSNVCRSCFRSAVAHCSNNVQNQFLHYTVNKQKSTNLAQLAHEIPVLLVLKFFSAVRQGFQSMPFIWIRGSNYSFWWIKKLAKNSYIFVSKSDNTIYVCITYYIWISNPAFNGGHFRDCSWPPIKLAEIEQSAETKSSVANSIFLMAVFSIVEYLFLFP